MAASVRIEDEAFSDERYEDLAHAAGLADADHARGKMARLWRQCTIEQTETLMGSTVERLLGTRGIEALEISRLGERVEGGRVRIKGTTGRIEWLGKLRDNGKFGHLGGRPKTHMGTHEGSLDQTPPAPAPAPVKEEEYICLARAAVAEINRIAKTGYEADSKNTLDHCRALHKRGVTAEQVIATIGARRDWLTDDKMRKYFRPDSLLRPSKLLVCLEDIQARKPKPKAPTPDEPPQLEHLWDSKK